MNNLAIWKYVHAQKLQQIYRKTHRYQTILIVKPREHEKTINSSIRKKRNKETVSQSPKSVLPPCHQFGSNIWVSIKERKYQSQLLSSFLLTHRSVLHRRHQA